MTPLKVKDIANRRVTIAAAGNLLVEIFGLLGRDKTHTCLCIWHGDDTEMRECASIDEELDEEEENHALSQGGLDTLNSIVVGTEYQNSQDDVVRNFDDNVGKDEGLPGVCFAGSFTDLVKRALVDEERHDLRGLVSKISLLREKAIHTC